MLLTFSAQRPSTKHLFLLSFWTNQRTLQQLPGNQVMGPCNSWCAQSNAWTIFSPEKHSSFPEDHLFVWSMYLVFSQCPGFCCRISVALTFSQNFSLSGNWNLDVILAVAVAIQHCDALYIEHNVPLKLCLLCLHSVSTCSGVLMTVRINSS